MAEESKDEMDEIVWQRSLIEKLALDTVKGQRHKRRWRSLFRLLLLVGLITLFYLAATGKMSTQDLNVGDHTAVIAIDDVIMPKEQGISADQVAKGLKHAYKDKSTKGIILQINSPGGSPVQSARIYKEIRRLKQEHEEIPVYAVIGDMGASGAYYVAAAADQIYANESSIVGSIGVRMGEFGFVDAIGKLGVERRVIIAGQNKTTLDPFLPLTESDKVHAEEMLADVHQQFIEAVRTGRGDRLKENDDLFSGLFWSGLKAKEYGLIDGFGDSRHVAAELIGVEKVVDFTVRETPLDRLISRLGIGIGTAFTRMLEHSSAAGMR
ncbi:MAG: S49 family peptidase [Pseudomonadota bacterium]